MPHSYKFTRSFWVVTISLVLLTLFTGGCTTDQTPTAEPILAGTPASPSPTPNPAHTEIPHFVGGSIIVGGVGQPGREVIGLPRLVSDALYDSLLHVNPADGSLEPGMADAWQVSADALTLSFHLREGLRWHDGKPVTAQDVVFTFKTLSDPALRLTPTADFGSLAEVTATDPQTVSVRLKAAYCAALTYLGTLKILPEHVLANKQLDSLTGTQFVGSGPLVLQSWNQDALTFARNENYWDGPPAIDKWTYKIFASQADAQAALVAGQVDVLQVTEKAALDGPPLYPRVLDQFYGLAFNQERDLFKDTRVRQAIVAALDRRKLVHDLFGDDGQVLETSALKDFWAGSDQAAQPAYNPSRARDLLAQAGWRDTDNDGILDKDGKPLRVTLYAIADDPIAEPLAFGIRAMLAQSGVQVLLQLDDRYGTLTRIFLHEYDLALAAWNIPLDPDQHWYWQSKENVKGKGFNVISYTNAKVDELLLRGNGVARCDPKARRTIYADISQTLAQDVPQVFLFAPPAYLAARSRVIGLAPSSFAGDFWNLEKWQVKP